MFALVADTRYGKRTAAPRPAPALRPAPRRPFAPDVTAIGLALECDLARGAVGFVEHGRMGPASPRYRSID